MRPSELRAIDRDFPEISDPGIFPLSELHYGGAFAELVADIESADLEAILEDKFGLTLSSRPLMITVRGHCRRRDGRIHNDPKDKLVTCLLYLNAAGWTRTAAGCAFYDATISSTIAEIAPDRRKFRGVPPYGKFLARP